MADATDLKSVDRKVVWVRLPPSAPFHFSSLWAADDGGLSNDVVAFLCAYGVRTGRATTPLGHRFCGA
jgi:hypothetical protein